MNMNNKKDFQCILAVLLLVSTIFFLVGCANSEGNDALGNGQISEKTEIEIYSFPAGTHIYALAVGIAEFINNESEILQATAVESTGTSRNIQLLLKEKNRRSNTFVFASPNALFRAYLGLSPYEEKDESVKPVVNMGYSVTGIVAGDPKIKTPEDLTGKKVAVGTAPSTNMTDIPMFMVQEKANNVRFQEMGPTDAANALKDGLIDATYTTGTITSIDPLKFSVSPAYIETFEMKDVNFISYDQNIINSVFSKLGEPYSDPITIPQGQFHAKQKEPWTCSVDALTWAAHEDMPEEIVLEFLKIFYENIDKFVEYTPMGGVLTKDNIAKMVVPEDIIHPAAMKFFKEKGIQPGGFPAAE